MTIWFDMDGTIADLYGVNNWLEYLLNNDVFPYENAKPLLNMAYFSRLLHKAQKSGYEIGVISWTSRGGSDLYNGQVALAKMLWLHKHLPSVTWDKIKIVPYGTNKYNTCKEGVLFDDEKNNRDNWNNGAAFTPEKIIEFLKAL